VLSVIEEDLRDESKTINLQKTTVIQQVAE